MYHRRIDPTIRANRIEDDTGKLYSLCLHRCTGIILLPNNHEKRRRRRSNEERYRIVILAAAEAEEEASFRPMTNIIARRLVS